MNQLVIRELGSLKRTDVKSRDDLHIAGARWRQAVLRTACMGKSPRWRHKGEREWRGLPETVEPFGKDREGDRVDSQRIGEAEDAAAAGR